MPAAALLRAQPRRRSQPAAAPASLRGAAAASAQGQAAARAPARLLQVDGRRRASSTSPRPPPPEGVVYTHDPRPRLGKARRRCAIPRHAPRSTRACSSPTSTRARRSTTSGASRRPSASWRRRTSCGRATSSVLNLLGLVYFKQEKLEKAEEVYRKLAAESPEAPTLFYNLGLIYFKLNRLEEAEAAFLEGARAGRRQPEDQLLPGLDLRAAAALPGRDLPVPPGRRQPDGAPRRGQAGGGGAAAAARGAARAAQRRPDDTAEFNAREIRQALKQHGERAAPEDTLVPPARTLAAGQRRPAWRRASTRTPRASDTARLRHAAAAAAARPARSRGDRLRGATSAAGRPTTSAAPRRAAHRRLPLPREQPDGDQRQRARSSSSRGRSTPTAATSPSGSRTAGRAATPRW